MTHRSAFLKVTAISAAILAIGLLPVSLEARTQAESNSFVPKSLAGMKMKYSDLHGNYTYVFAGDGTFSWTSTREHEQPDTRKGNYKWHVKGSRQAVLDCGEGEVFNLTFDSPTHAKGTVTDDVRIYSFTFEK